MKVRNGFVSNSSSSSFIVVAPKGYKWNENRILEEKYGENAKDIIDIYKRAFYPKSDMCLGQPIELYHGTSYSCEPCWDIYNQDKCEALCEKMGKEIYDFANELYDLFPSLFDTPECLVNWEC